MVNVVHDSLCMCFTMRSNEVFLYPCNEVIFECAFNHLMEKIGRKKFMNVRSGEIIGERLQKKEVSVSRSVENKQ